MRASHIALILAVLAIPSVGYAQQDNGSVGGPVGGPVGGMVGPEGWATTPFAWVAIWVTHSSGPGHRLLGRHHGRPGRLASGCRGRGAAKCTRHAASGRNRLRFHQRSARAG